MAKIKVEMEILTVEKEEGEMARGLDNGYGHLCESHGLSARRA